MKAGLKKYGIPAAVSIGITVFYMVSKGREQTNALHLLCDGFTVSGFLYVLSAALILLINAGAIDGLGYLGGFLLHAFVQEKSRESYYDYIRRKQEKRHYMPFVRPMLAVGGFDLLMGCVFLALYYIA